MIGFVIKKNSLNFLSINNNTYKFLSSYFLQLNPIKKFFKFYRSYHKIAFKVRTIVEEDLIELMKI